VPRQTVAYDTCNKCGHPITGRVVGTGDGQTFHPECLTCDGCGSAVQGNFNLRNGRKLCDTCVNSNVKTCTKCGLAIGGGAVTTKDGSQFHPQCLVCDHCGIVLAGPFHLHEGARLCDGCVPRSGAQKMCQKCGQGIAGQYVTVGEGAFLHSECFTCASCFAPLSGVRLIRSERTGLAFCSENCHDRGPAMVPMGTMTAVPTQPMPSGGFATPNEPVPSAPVSKKDSSKKKSAKKAKSSKCCA